MVAFMSPEDLEAIQRLALQQVCYLRSEVGRFYDLCSGIVQRLLLLIRPVEILRLGLEVDLFLKETRLRRC